MQETIEGNKTTDHEIKTSERTEHSHEPESVRSNKRVIFIVAGLLALCLGAAIYWVRGGQPTVAPPAEAATEAMPDVAVTTDEQLRQIAVEPVTERVADLERETTGKVAFNEERMTPVFTPYAGRVLELNVSKGEVVKAGQPLLTIESPDLVSAQNDLAAARSDENKARIALDAAQKIAERAHNLHEREALATKDLQQAESDLARAKDDLRRSQAAVAYAESRLALFGKNGGQLAEAGNSNGATGSDRRVVIHAPIGGTIVERKVGNGQYIKPDMPDPLFLITDLSTVWVMADVYESYLAKIRVGQPVEITVPAYPDRRFPARISFINPTVDPATRTVHVRCLVPNPKGLLKPDMFARINIGAASPRPVAVVPTGAIFTKGTDSFVFVEESPKHFRRRQIGVGREVQGSTVVESGLRPGDRVAIHGVLLLDRIIESGGKND